MTETVEIPEDVIKAAIAVRADGHSKPNWYLEQPHVDAIARAILAEREACAKIAEDLKANPQGIRLAMGELSSQEMRSVKAVLSFVAAAIRRR